MMTLLLALGALVLFISLFLHGAGLSSARAALPTTTEAGNNGLLGAVTWLKGGGIRTVSLRERFDSLARRSDLPPTGNLLIVTLPVVTPYGVAEIEALKKWLNAGNTLLVLAALSDRPDWASEGVGDELRLLTDLETDSQHSERAQTAHGKAATPAAGSAARHGPDTRPDSAEMLRRLQAANTRLPQPQRSTLVPNRLHPYFSGVATAEAVSDYPPQARTVTLPRDDFILSLAHARETGNEVFWTRGGHSGTLILSGFGSLFSNRALGLADNARLLGNIVAVTVGADGAVLFDDEHQGLAAAYDPGKFYRDLRLYETLGIIALVWLTWVLGGTQLRLPPRRAAAPREAELVQATGLFLARVLRPAAAARRMYEQFFRRVAASSRRPLPIDRAPWEWLENHPRLAREDVEQLKEWYAQAHAQRRLSLKHLHNLIVRTERQLAA